MIIMREQQDELLFFDTFSHEVDSDINLDLVQFPNPVYITQVRIIPLGARVQADFPGGVRLGATNPSKFGIEFFVNDLGMPGTSTFENLGSLEYNQNDCIHLECNHEKIPTDGLVLRGWYSTITLAVYGILTNSVAEQIASPPPPPCEPTPSEDVCSVPLQEDSVVNLGILASIDEPIKSEWKESHEAHVHVAKKSADYDRDGLEFPTLMPSSTLPFHQPESNEREYIMHQQQKASRGSRSPEYRHSRRLKTDRSRDTETVDQQQIHKWQPRTPPHSHSQAIESPSRPRSPDLPDLDYSSELIYKVKSRTHSHPSDKIATTTNSDNVANGDIVNDDASGTQGEQFEPILSDDEIIGDDDNSMSGGPTTNIVDEEDLEIEAAAAQCENSIKYFDPFKTTITSFTVNLKSFYSKEVDDILMILKKFQQQTKTESRNTFCNATTVDERENFVYICEELTTQLAFISLNYRKRNAILDELFQESDQQLLEISQILQIALDFECACAQLQPAFKIRHIKVGVYLTELLGCSKNLLNFIVTNCKSFDPFQAIFELYRQDYMALSIKLKLLKGIYSLLDTSEGVKLFLNGKLNGYQYLLEVLQQSHLTRPKFAIRSIIKKLNLYESLETIHDICTKQFVLTNCYCDENFDILEEAIEGVITALHEDSLSYQQPKRFLPVSKKFEIVKDQTAERNWSNTLQSYFRIQSLSESIFLIVSNQTEIPLSLLSRTLELLEILMQQHTGIDYFVDDCFETTQALVYCLLGVSDLLPNNENQEGKNETETSKEEVKISIIKCEDESLTNEIENDLKADVIVDTMSSNRMHRLGMELAYKVQTRYHIDAITYSTECDFISLTTHLHELYSQTCSNPGRRYTIDVIGVNNHLQSFLDLIEKERYMQKEWQRNTPGAKYKSPVLSYAVDIIDCCVRHCEKLDYLIENGAAILEMAKNHDLFEPSVSAVLQEMYVYLKPLEITNSFAYDDINGLVEVITRSLEYITTFPGDLIMGLRIMRYLTVGSRSKQSAETTELKHRYAALQFYAADGVQTLLHILDKLTTYFEQPGLHSPILVSTQGMYCCQILLPTLQILREMLTFAISSRDIEFKDLTAIDPIMKIYFLMYYFPRTSQAADACYEIKTEIIQILLAYTQPIEEDEESLHKSLWTQMVREVIKNILNGPSTFVPGLLVLAELLPLPLPFPTTMLLSETHAQRLLTERKLWSAHLHPESGLIARLIETIIPTSFPQLSDLLTRVCVQLSDLAPNMTLLVSKTITDLLISEWNAAGSGMSAQLARLLNFFAELTSYASVKSSALSIFYGKFWELLQSALVTSSSQQAKTPIDKTISIKCQIAVHRIFENFFDSEISLISPYSTSSPDVNLASALPPREIIPRMIDAIIMNLLSMDLTENLTVAAARTVIIVTEHDITFYHLVQCLKNKRKEFQIWLRKLIEANENGTFQGIVDTVVLLFRSLTCIEDSTSSDTIIPNRTLKISMLELANLIGFKEDHVSEPGKENKNILKRIRNLLEKQQEQISQSVLSDIDNLTMELEAIAFTESNIDDDYFNIGPEPFLPQTEGIVTQYASRPIFTIYEALTDEQQLRQQFWLETIRLETISKSDLDQCERIPCNLTEIINSFLPSDTNLSSDCKRVLHLSASPQSNRERTPTAPCFRTRRVEVESTDGRPESKLYITPVRGGRGYSRPPPSRGDLFRSRPPNTSRPPSLHVDDFLALETCGAQPTGPTGYNKMPIIRGGSRIGRNRGTHSSAGLYRKPKPLRTSSPSLWSDSTSSHFRTATSEPVVTSHYSSDLHYSSSSHFTGRQRGRGRIRTYLR